MKLQSFRELLLKKAEENPDLFVLLKYAREEILAEKIFETLEKMARARHKGDAANFAVRDFATEMDPEQEPHMLRDAIGHHVSRYKAALKGGRSELANRHAKQALNLMNVADVAQKHSGGKLAIDYVPIQPWERSKLSAQYEKDHPKVQEGKYKEGDYKTKTKGLNYAQKGGDFSFLQSAPHHSYQKEVKRHGHNKAYPFEQTRVNGKYIHIDDIDPSELKGYEEHPFDAHPILQHYSHSPTALDSAENNKKYIEARDKYYNEHPHIENYYKKHSELEAKDPEGYSKRGSAASQAVHPEVEGLDLNAVFDKYGKLVSGGSKPPVATPVKADTPTQESKPAAAPTEGVKPTVAPTAAAPAAAPKPAVKEHTHTYHAPSGQKIPFHAEKSPGLLDYFKGQKEGKLEEH